MMLRWIGWAVKTVATALLLSFLCIWTTGYIVNSYMETLLKQLNLPLQVQPFALSGVWGKLWGASPVSGTSGESASGNWSGESASDDQDDGVEATERDAGPSSAARSRTTDRNMAGTDAMRTDAGRMAAEASEMGEEEAEEISRNGDAWGMLDDHGDDASVLDHSIPPIGSNASSVPEMTSEQRQLLKTVMSKLNGEQLAQLAQYLEDGITESELADVGELLAPILTETEYMQIMELFHPVRATIASETE
jgi:hypothetical protein